MKDKQLIFRSPQKKDHLDILSRQHAFHFPRAFCRSATSFYKNNYLTNSHYRWSESRLGIMDDKIVTHCGIFEKELRVGSSFVKTAGVGGIYTDPKLQGRGYMTETMKRSLDNLNPRKYGLSLVISGIQNYYERFGYVRAWDEHMFFFTL